MKRHQFSLGILISIVLIVVGFIYIDVQTTNQIASMKQSIVDEISGTKQHISFSGDNSNLYVFQNALSTNLNTVKQSTVTILRQKEVKSYFENLELFDALEHTDQKIDMGGGVGTIVSREGYILTNKHVVQDTNSQYSIVGPDHVVYTVDKMWFDPFLDIAIIKILLPEDSQSNFTEVSFLSFDDLVSSSNFVFAIGHSDYPGHISMGVLGSQTVPIKTKQKNIYAKYYNTDMAISAGNSGSPLVDIFGQVVGINTAMISTTSTMGLALPITQEFVDQTMYGIVKYNKIVRPFVGITYKDSFDDQQHIEGIEIQDVVFDSPAQQAGLQKGDQIIAINQKSITDTYPFLYQLYTYVPGQEIEFSVMRENQIISKKIVLGANL